METMYWITRLDALNITFGILLIISIFGTIAFIVANIISATSEFENIREGAKMVKQKLTLFVVIFIISTIGCIFIPNTNEALVIYGIGGTLEWVKDNDKAKQLPDKAVEALSLYLDNINAELKENNEDTKIE